MLAKLSKSMTFKVLAYAMILSIFNAPLEGNRRFNTVFEVVALASEVEAMTDGEEGGDLIELSQSAEQALDVAILKVKEKNITDEQFKAMTDKEFPKYTEKMKRKIDRMSEKRASRKVKQYEKLAAISTDKEFNGEINGILSSSASSKDKLMKLHGENYDAKFKQQLTSDVKGAGGVLKYLKLVKKKLKSEKEYAMKSYDKEGRYVADDGKGGGISLGGLLLLTGIILLILGSAVVGPVWITVGWVLVWVFGITPVSILLIYLIVIAIIAIAAQNSVLPEKNKRLLRVVG